MENHTQAQIQVLLANHLRTALDEHENWRIRIPEPLPDSEVENQVLAYDYLLKDTQADLSRCDYQRTLPAVKELISGSDIRLDEDSPEMRQVCRDYLKVDAEILRRERQRTRGDYSGDPVLTQSVATAPVASPVSTKKILLSTVVEEWVSENNGVSWGTKTASENIAAVALLQEFVGDIDVTAVTYEHAREFKALLLKLPANRRKSKRYRDKSIGKILALKNVRPMTRRSANKYIAKASQFGVWATRHGYWPRNFFEGMTLPEDERADQQRKIFDPDDLKALFGSPGYLENGFKSPFQYWVPLIAFFSGMRIDEICQLYLDDIQEIDGVAAISINDDLDKKLKNKASRRIIPIHPKLIDLGFLEYVGTLRQKGCRRVFPELPRGRDGYGQKASRWFGLYRKTCGVTDPKKVFHSYRHTYDTTLSHQMMPIQILLQLMGHERGASESEARYRKDFPPSIVLPYLEKIDFGINLSHLAGRWQALMAK
jgi:integrase